ncbi:MAG TPA: class I SAM-dependent methyltransferase [Casimicrobiaceae bacterium]|nr:class I SAM-dependent methyltransferase [Casimicrobiaceae bacterium]
MNRRYFGAALLGCGVALAAALHAQTAPVTRAPDVPYEPSPPEVVRAMLELAAVKPSDTVYDLGSGDGRIVIAAARDFGARAIGIDIDPKRIAESNENAKGAGVNGRVKFVQGDLFASDFSDASVVTLFLWPHINLKLRPQLEKLKPGTRIVSHVHDLGDWKPDRTVKVRLTDGGRERTLYLWTVRGS